MFSVTMHCDVKRQVIWFIPVQVVIDVESGAFGDNGSLDFIKIEQDKIIDQNSNHIGSFTYVA